MEQDGQLCMTEGPIGRELLQLALPVLLSQLLQQFYNIADASIIGQAAGEGQLERVRKGMKISIWAGLGVWAVFAVLLLAAEPLILPFFTADRAVLQNAGTAIRYIFPFYCIYAVNQVYIGVLRGMGHTFSQMVVTVLCYCVFRIAWCGLLLPLWHDMRVIYLSYILSWVIMIVLMAFCCRRCLAGACGAEALK